MRTNLSMMKKGLPFLLEIPISKKVRETNYQDFRAIEDAYERLAQEIVSQL